MIDVNELKRMMTNASDADQRQSLGNLIRGINILENENRKLKVENAKLLEQLDSA